MIHFNECDVIVNGTGLTADSASLSNENSLIPMYGLGFKKVNKIPNQQPISNIQINYTPNIDNEVNFGIINNLKKNPPIITPINIEIAGLECSGYLVSYSLSCKPNEPTQASVSYISYYNLDGNIIPKRDTVNYEQNNDNLGHAIATVVEYNRTVTGYLATYNFDYSINFEYDPIYVIGKKNPSEIVMLGGKEEIKLVKEEFLKVNFSGGDINQIFPNGIDSIHIHNLEQSWNNIRTGALYFNFLDAEVTSSRLSANKNDYVNIEIVAGREF